MVRMRRPATNSVTRRMLRPLIVTRKERVPHRVCVRRRAEADVARVPATLLCGAGVVTGVAADVAAGAAAAGGVTTVPGGVVAGGVTPVACAAPRRAAGEGGGGPGAAVCGG